MPDSRWFLPKALHQVYELGRLEASATSSDMTWRSEVMLEKLSLQLYCSAVEGTGEAWQGWGYPPQRVVPQQPCASPCPARLCGSILVLVLPDALPGLGWVVWDCWRA